MFFTDSNGESTNFCPDCSKWIEPKCQVDKSGMTIAKSVDGPKLQKLKEGEVIDPSLAKCIDDTFKLTGN